jgi:hypothetical protein
VKLQSTAAEPATAPAGEPGWLGEFGQAERVTPELPAGVLSADRDRELNTTEWSIDPYALALLACVAYLLGVRRPHRAGENWPTAPAGSHRSNHKQPIKISNCA